MQNSLELGSTENTKKYATFFKGLTFALVLLAVLANLPIIILTFFGQSADSGDYLAGSTFSIIQPWIELFFCFLLLYLSCNSLYSFKKVSVDYRSISKWIFVALGHSAYMLFRYATLRTSVLYHARQFYYILLTLAILLAICSWCAANNSTKNFKLVGLVCLLVLVLGFTMVMLAQ